MEAFVLFPRSDGRMGSAACEEQQEEEDIGCPSESETSAMDSMSSSEEVELDDDATSSSSGSTDNFEMSSLMSQLPLKRGLSKFFDGKSQSFASLAAVGGLAEDLAKPPLQKRLKTSRRRRSCGVGLQDAHRRRFSRPSRCHSNAANAGFKKVSRGRISLLGGGAAPSRLTLRPVTASAARAEGLPGRGALLFA